MRNIFYICFICCAVFICFMPALSSADMRGLSTEELAISADTVITGTVDDIKSEWSSDGKTIVTKVSVVTDRLIGGKAVSQKVTVEYDGGEVGGIGLKVSDMTSFKKGESVLLFLKEGNSKVNGRVHHMVGKAQGAYKVDKSNIARKSGFSAVDKHNVVDSDIALDALIEKIKKVKK